jgi:predicted MPP superfamily phosphohydrolase
MSTEETRKADDAAPATAGKVDSGGDEANGPISRRQFLLRNAAVAGTALVGEGMVAEDDPRVSTYTHVVAGLREPVRLVQLSDLHRSWCVSEAYLQRVADQANALKPDAILLTGDFVTDWSTYMDSCAGVLKQLHAPLGTFGVLGNHDYSCDRRRGGPAITDGLRAAGVTVLTNRSFLLDSGLNIVGVDDCWLGAPNPELAFSRVHQGEPSLIMTHNPLIFPSLGRYDSITVAGHTHGGQINVPILTRRLVMRRHPYLKGWFRCPDGPGRMYVSRGVGVVGIPIRLRCDPEITVFNLVPA